LLFPLQKWKYCALLYLSSFQATAHEDFPEEPCGSGGIDHARSGCDEHDFKPLPQEEVHEDAGSGASHGTGNHVEYAAVSKRQSYKADDDAECHGDGDVQDGRGPHRHA
jgi:hypothetical protein